MYAVIKTGGKQYKVTEGDLLRVEKLEGEAGAEIAFEDVLMYSDGEKISLDGEKLDGISVKGHIVEQGREKKILVFKYKRRKGYRKMQGHRQPYTAVKIDSIDA
jgi:large subunit ribosomal protein L21